MEDENPEKQLYKYINGVRYVNPEFNQFMTLNEINHEVFNNDIVSEVFDGEQQKFLECTTEQEKLDFAEKMIKMVENMPSDVFFESEEISDEAIEKIMLYELYKNGSMGVVITCPICKYDVSHSHFENHTAIFERGCIYCKKQLVKDNFPNYKEHIHIKHSDKIKKFFQINKM